MVKKIELTNENTKLKNEFLKKELKEPTPYSLVETESDEKEENEKKNERDSDSSYEPEVNIIALC